MTALLRRTVIGLLIAVPLLVLVLFRTDLSETYDAAKQADYAYIPLAMLLFSASVWLQAVRWHFLLNPLTPVSARRLAPVVFIGHLGNILVPLRGGEIIRVLVVNQREGVSRMAALGTLAVERTLDGLVLTGMLIVSIALVETSDRYLGLVVAGGLIFGCLTGALVALAFWPQTALDLVEPLIRRAPARWHGRIRRWLRSFLRGTSALRTWTGVLGVLVTTCCFWALIAVVYWIVGEAFGIQEGFQTYILVAAVANLSYTIPSSQGGIGTFEFFVREALIYVGVAAPVATAYALVIHAVAIIPLVVLGLLALWRARISLTDLVKSAAMGISSEEDTVDVSRSSRQSEAFAGRTASEEGASLDRS